MPQARILTRFVSLVTHEFNISNLEPKNILLSELSIISGVQGIEGLDYSGGVKILRFLYNILIFPFPNENLHRSVQDIEIPGEVTFGKHIHVLLGNKE